MIHKKNLALFCCKIFHVAAYFEFFKLKNSFGRDKNELEEICTGKTLSLKIIRKIIEKGFEDAFRNLYDFE